MKRSRKFFASVALAACLTVFSASNSAFAAYGWGDTMETAQVMYSNVQQSPYYSATIPLHGMDDNDYYLVDNTQGSSGFTYTVIVTPPENFDIALGIVQMREDGSITYLDFLNGNGRGYPEAISAYIPAGEKVYFRVLDNGINNYDKPYTIQFTKTS
ncbi:hypothetical protein [Paenibacillus azoreducens]|uniref:Uncharacterized protein n=1 Tax=Paenibacillus azoreducens TaxID=116718 RepID=A0A920CT63_9BACL|nr:hypothetical protein [Paenibacillus azoreducens]GIO48879.1 hypothetical protein J34TS1_36440 [Paenibacillus azoreducens]